MIILILVSSYLMHSFFRNEEAKLIQTNNQILDMIEVYDISLKQSANKTESVFKLIAKEAGIEYISQQDIDSFSEKTGTVATIFRKQDDNFLRIKTSLLAKDGTRAVGTYLDKTHPAYSFLLKQKSYFGKSRLFDKDYMTKYEPILENGIYVGARFIGIDITKDLEDLKSKIRKIKIGETRYSYVMSYNETNKAERSLLQKNKK